MISASCLPLSLGIGPVAGGLSTVKGVKYCLEHYRAQTVYTILGMLVGSLYSIIAGPETLTPRQPMLSFSNFNWLFFLIGAILIAAMQLLKLRREKAIKQ